MIKLNKQKKIIFYKNFWKNSRFRQPRNELLLKIPTVSPQSLSGPTEGCANTFPNRIRNRSDTILCAINSNTGYKTILTFSFDNKAPFEL